MSDVLGAVCAPQDAIWDRVAVASEHIRLKLDGCHASIHLHDLAHQPAMNVLSILDIVTQNFGPFAHHKFSFAFHPMIYLLQ
jgi:hypothetical protein